MTRRPPLPPDRLATLGLAALAALAGGATTGAAPDAALAPIPAAAGPAAAGPTAAPRAGLIAPTAAERDRILAALRAMQRQPGDFIPLSVADCYEVMAPPDDVAYTCHGCGASTTLSLSGGQGPGKPSPVLRSLGETDGPTPAAEAWSMAGAAYLARELPRLRSLLDRLPAGSQIDERTLCPTCARGDPAAVVFTYPCLGCGTPLTFRVARAADLVPAGWLALPLPGGRIDDRDLEAYDAATVASGVRCIHERRFCPGCQTKFPLTTP